VRTKRVSSWLELQEELFAGSWHDRLTRHRASFAFRGRGDAQHELSTSLARLGGDASDLERHIVRAFRKYAARDSVPVDSIWNWLALGQHHGLPTRLLDWTFSPYVALHFVTADLDRFDRDGVVWCVDYTRVHELLPEPLKAVLRGEGADVFTTDMLDRAVGDLVALGELGEFVLFLEPPSFDARIVNQYALFSLVSRADVPLGAWLDERPELARAIVVPAGLKWEIRDKLDLANVTERVLFPGLDGLSSWLGRYYLPRPDRA
jgi:FRG domain-containing protein